jgi:hypothetical protein
MDRENLIKESETIRELIKNFEKRFESYFK